MEEKIYILISKKLTGEVLDEVESKDFEAWYIHNAKEFQDLEQKWTELGKYKPALNFDIEKEWDKIESSTERKQTKLLKINSNRWLKLAAALLIIAISTLVLINFQKYQEITYDELGQNSYVLPDKSEVWLNKNSSIEFADNFTPNQRKISLQGEGYFKITKDIQRPFIISSSNIKVEVLGTEFNLKSYPKSSAIELVLVEGKVSFENTSNSEKVTVMPGETVIFNKITSTINKNTNNDSNSMAWKDKKLIFQNAPMEKVIADLSEYFNYSITIKNNKIYNCSLTSSFDNPELKEVLNIIEQTMNLEVSFSEGTIELSGEGCN